MGLPRTCLLFIIVAVAAEAAVTPSPKSTTTAQTTPSKEPLSKLIYTCDEGSKTYKLDFTAVTDFDSYFITDGKAPDKGTMYGATLTNCSTHLLDMLGSNATVTLGSCTHNPFVYLMKGHTNSQAKLVGGKSFHEYELQCKMPDGGVAVKVEGGVTISVPAPTSESLNATANLTMKFTDKSDIAQKTFMISETLILDIHDNSAVDHDMKLLSCDAFPDSTKAEKAIIYTTSTKPNGEIFESLNTTTKDIIVHLHAFRFASSPTVYMQCTVRVCNQNDAACTPNSRRRRRAADRPDSIATVEGSFTIGQGDSDKPTASGQATAMPWCASVVSMVAVAISIFMRK